MAMKSTSKVEDVDVLGIVVDGAMFNQVVNDVHEGAINVPTKVEGKAPFQVTKELVMVVHNDVVGTHDVATNGVAILVVLV